MHQFHNIYIYTHMGVVMPMVHAMELTFTRVLSVALLGLLLIVISDMTEGRLRTIPEAFTDSIDKQAATKDQEGQISKDFDDDNLLRGIYATGSTLPDCSHACGPCSPCRRVMVSFKCSVGESCPIVYRCMCRGKFYHVPSN